MGKSETRRLSLIAMVSAMAVVVTLLIRFPLVPSVSFMQYDPKDIVICIGAFILGPVAGAFITILSCGIEFLFKGGTVIDLVMNIVSTAVFVCTASWIYKVKPSTKRAVLGLLAGSALTLLVMLLWNYALTPIYLKMPRDAVITMLPAIALFNVLKYGINSLAVAFLYTPILHAVDKVSPLKEESKKEKIIIYSMTGLFLVICLAIAVLSFSKMI